MGDVFLFLAVEDELSEHVARKVLQSVSPLFKIHQVLGGNGFTYLKKNIEKFNQIARSIPFLLITDLDAADCPPTLLQEWGSDDLHSNFILRIAVREIESWILADRCGFSEYFKISKVNVPKEPDEIMDPKQYLVNIIRKKCRKKIIKEDIVPPKGATSNQGPGYNIRMGDFVYSGWNPVKAQENSVSLNGAIKRLKSFIKLTQSRKTAEAQR